ncbi:MAG: cysteine dioxygenase [Caulobacterales bacterium]|nr:cysteine dioxygenase [Caulobacterales bacterium]
MTAEALTAPNLRRLRDFVSGFAALLRATAAEARILEAGGVLLRDLVAQDDWLPEACGQACGHRYQQHLLHCDSLERFSVVSFVWGPGQATPVHDHTVWGLIGVLRGAELSQTYARRGGRLVPDGPPRRLDAGQVEPVSPRIGDIHQVSNVLSDRPSVSIHVYGGNIGAIRRTAYDADGRPNLFISGYSNATVPNVWDASRHEAP